jgi:hypothetical protein
MLLTGKSLVMSAPGLGRSQKEFSIPERPVSLLKLAGDSLPNLANCNHLDAIFNIPVFESLLLFILSRS